MAAQPKSTLDEPSSKTSSMRYPSPDSANLPDKKALMPDEAKPVNLDNPSRDLSIVEDGVPEKLPSPNEVNWENDNDPQNPMNWSSFVKWQNLGVISAMTFITPLTSTMFAPAVPLLPSNFHLTTTTSTLVVSIFVLGFAVGPLIIAPVSEIYGRRPAYVISMFFFLIFTVACAVSTSLPMLIVFRFLTGTAGSTPITIGAATVGDMFPPDKRGGSMAVMVMGPLLGPIIGPIIGGYLATAEGWKWVFWLQAIVAAALLLLGFLLLKETYAVVILEHKARILRKEMGNLELRSALHDGLTPKQRLRTSLVRPLKMLFVEPIVFVLSLYVAVVFGYLYLFLTSFPWVFSEQYGFSAGATGLTYIGVGVGLFFGTVITGKGSDFTYKRLQKRNNGNAKPEFRLPPLVVSAPLVAVAFFWYGWSAEAKTHWIVPIIGTVVFGLGQMPAFMCINMYLVQAYGRYAASAIAASKVLQSIGGSFLPLAGQPLFNALGFGWGNSLLAFLAMLFIPVPFVLLKYGEKLRTMTKAQY